MIKLELTDQDAYNIFLALEDPESHLLHVKSEQDGVVERIIRWATTHHQHGTKEDFMVGVTRFQEKVEALEEQDLEYDPNGPTITACEHCGVVSQYNAQHECSGTRSEDAAARDYEERAHGIDD